MIGFTETYPQDINFGNGFRTGLSKRSVMHWAYFTTFTSSVIHGLAWITVGSSTEELFYTFTTSAALSGRFGVTARWSGALAAWYTNSAYATTGQWYHFAVTYDNASTSNDPIIYVNGASVAITESTAPSGTYATGSVNQEFGPGGWGGNTINGRVAGTLLYNRILTAGEIADAYTSRLAVPNYNGLVFAPNLSGATGLQNFDGVTLASGNTLIDQISGAGGVPAGSPVGRADTYLTLGGLNGK